MRVDDLEPGDLVFRYRGETQFTEAVSTVVRGWSGLEVHHVALYEGAGWVWEASFEGVRRSRVADWSGGLLAGYLGPHWRKDDPDLVPRVLAWVRRQEGLPYNDTFDQSKTSFYCSELVIDAFKNGGVPLFPETALTFRDPQTGELVAYWVDYYAARGREVPEGAPGSHPASLSLSGELLVDYLML